MNDKMAAGMLPTANGVSDEGGIAPLTAVDLRLPFAETASPGHKQKLAWERLPKHSRYARDTRLAGGRQCRYPQGGDRRSHKTEAHSEQILALYQATPDITLEEIIRKLAEQGIKISMGALWRFFARRRISFKKSRRMRANKNGLTS